MSNRHYLLLFALVPALACAQQLAVDTQAKLSVGVNATFHRQSYAIDNDISFMPQAFYDNNRWYIEGAEAGYYPYKDAQNHLRVGLSYDGRDFQPKDANSDALKMLNKRDWSAVAHASYMRITPYGGLKVKATTDALNRHNGQTLSLSHLSKFNKDKLTVYPEVGVIWQSKDYNQYYYGISDDESKKTKLVAYQASSGVMPFATVSASYQVTPNISVFANQRLEWLSNSQKTSPLTEGSLDSKTRFGVNYKF